MTAIDPFIEHHKLCSSMATGICSNFNDFLSFSILLSHIVISRNPPAYMQCLFIPLFLSLLSISGFTWRVCRNGIKHVLCLLLQLSSLTLHEVFKVYPANHMYPLYFLWLNEIPLYDYISISIYSFTKLCCSQTLLWRLLLWMSVQVWNPLCIYW